MQRLKTLGTNKQLMLQFSPDHITPPYAFRYLLQQTVPVRPKIEYMCENRDRNALWWRVSMKEIVPFKRVVRSWLARRVRRAFEEELKERDYDAQGSRLNSDSHNSTAAASTAGHLRGSVTLTIHPDCLKAKYPTIRESVKPLIDLLVQEHGKQKQQEKQPGKQKRRIQPRGPQWPKLQQEKQKHERSMSSRKEPPPLTRRQQQQQEKPSNWTIAPQVTGLKLAMSPIKLRPRTDD
ncbi:hypothetical protein BJX70DRAFT_358859 [Aspergillus crustosus]